MPAVARATGDGTTATATDEGLTTTGLAMLGLGVIVRRLARHPAPLAQPDLIRRQPSGRGRHRAQALRRADRGVHGSPASPGLRREPYPALVSDLRCRSARRYSGSGPRPWLPATGNARHPGPVSGPLVPMARSVPLSLAIPRIGIRAKIVPLGLQPDGAPAVPPLATPFVTSWYDPGPTPGAAGAAVIFGHVDSAAVGPAVFYDLGRLRTGDRVNVALADRRTAVFRVYGGACTRRRTSRRRACPGTPGGPRCGW